MTCERGFGLTCNNVPQPHRTVTTPTGERATIWTIRYSTNGKVRTREGGFGLTRNNVPQVHPAPILAGERPTIRAIRYTGDSPLCIPVRVAVS